MTSMKKVLKSFAPLMLLFYSFIVLLSPAYAYDYQNRDVKCSYTLYSDNSCLAWTEFFTFSRANIVRANEGFIMYVRPSFNNTRIQGFQLFEPSQFTSLASAFDISKEILPVERIEGDYRLWLKAPAVKGDHTLSFSGVTSTGENIIFDMPLLVYGNQPKDLTLYYIGGAIFGVAILLAAHGPTANVTDTCIMAVVSCIAGYAGAMVGGYIGDRVVPEPKENIPSP